MEENTGRTVKEWIGKTPDSVPPESVKQRVRKRFNSICQCLDKCGIEIRTGMAWDAEHTIPLSMKGENRENNLTPMLTAHHKKKTAVEATVRAKADAVGRKHMRSARRKKSKWAYGRDSAFKKTIDGRVVRRTKG